jgi:hypothetical protein
MTTAMHVPTLHDPTLHDPSLQTLQTTAQATRRAFEAGLFDVAIARLAYGAYAPGLDIDLFLARSRALFPALNCGLCSAYLRAVLGRGSIRRGRYDGEAHTVLAIGSTIIDITADQFGGPPVYVGPPRRPWELPHDAAF